MAKKDAKKKKDNKKGSGAADTVEAVRSAVERALPEGSKERGRELVDEVARAVTRVRESLEQHGVFDELGKLRAEVETLARRVANLERPAGTPTKAPSTASKPAATKTRSTASKTSRSTTSKAKTSRTTKKPSSSRTTKKPSSSRTRATKSRSTSPPSGS